LPTKSAWRSCGRPPKPWARRSSRWLAGTRGPWRRNRLRAIVITSGVTRDALDTLRKELLKYRPPEEEKARQLAREARESARMCGCCSRELLACEPVYYGAKVYVGLLPLLRKRQIWEACYARTVLCGSCAPAWLSSESDDVVTQLCAYCERPMVSRLELSALENAFCCNACQRAYNAQLRREQRAEVLKKVCAVCGEEFTATRRDAKTCSDGCRQKAYRRRTKEVQ
jgi:hypothetical protein